MTKAELNKLIQGTRIGLTERDKPALRAAQLYFVEGEQNVTECAKKAGCVRQTAARTINRIKEIIDQQGMEVVMVLVPKGCQLKESLIQAKKYIHQAKNEAEARHDNPDSDAYMEQQEYETMKEAENLLRQIDEIITGSP